MPTVPHHHQPPAEFIDKHMIANVEGVLIHEYVKRRPGPAPSKNELSAFICSLGAAELLSIVREHPGMRSLRANIRNDADVLRWAAALK